MALPLETAMAGTYLAVASSADGSKLVLAPFNDVLYGSTDYGNSWNPLSVPMANWTGVATSADGVRWVAVNILPGTIYTSTNSGATWAPAITAPSTNWTAVASSADGLKLIAAAGGFSYTNGPLCTSTDAGVTWIQTTAPIAYWAAVASSADGTKLAAVDSGDSSWQHGGAIYFSTDSGGHWAPADAPTNSRWSDIACSADGTKWVAVSRALPPQVGFIYTSTDSGAHWQSNNIPDDSWITVASSADGDKLIATGAEILISTNGGVSWTPNSIPDLSVTSAAASADGDRYVAVSFLGHIYASYSTPSPLLHLAAYGNQFTLSWPVPSTNFVLQMSSDPASADWTTLTNQPVLNLSNLYEEILLAPTNLNGFFRLVSQ